MAFAALSLVLGPALVRFAGRFGSRSFSEASPGSSSIYFALVGVRLDLAHELDWALALGFVAATTAVKLVSVMLAARLAGAGAGRALD